MTRKTQGGAGGGGSRKYTINMDYSRSASREPWRCRVTGFKSPFFGNTELAVCLQVGQAIKSQNEHRTATISTATTATRQTRKKSARTRQRAGRQLAETL